MRAEEFRFIGMLSDMSNDDKLNILAHMEPRQKHTTLARIGFDELSNHFQFHKIDAIETTALWSSKPELRTILMVGTDIGTYCFKQFKEGDLNE